MPELGIDLPLEAGVKEFDSQYFNFHLLRSLLKELELIKPQMCLKLLKEMPDLSERTYCNLILRLSLPKIKQLLINDDVYLHLWEVFARFGNKKGRVNSEL
jgi:hypothetical protein